MNEREEQNDEIDICATNSTVELKNIELARKAGYLYFLLEDLKEYNNYEEEYAKAHEKQIKAFIALLVWRTKRRRNEYIGAKKECIMLRERHERIDAKKLEEKIKEYEELIDRKFWNIDDLTAIEAYLLLDRAKTIEEAVELLEKNKTAGY